MRNVIRHQRPGAARETADDFIARNATLFAAKSARLPAAPMKNFTEIAPRRHEKALTHYRVRPFVITAPGWREQAAIATAQADPLRG
jgi:hypothetical protein